MALKKNMNTEEIRQFLTEEVKEQILLEIAPILHLGKLPGGYFGVSRQILCMLEFLGSLYGGYDGKGNISNARKAKKFIRELMGENIDRYYKLNGSVMYDMYRHGLVHTYQPKTFKNNSGKELQWLSYKGPRNKHDLALKKDIFRGVRHLAIISRPRRPGTYCLCISINSLYYDLIHAIDLYVGILKKDKKMRIKFTQTANAITKSDNYSWKMGVGI